jgi:MoxR-like ATPase/DNA-binding MarR family transcriptional regulator
MENNTKKNKRTLLSSMEEIVNLAKKYSLEQEFYERASASIKYASKILSLTKDEAMLLAFFLEHSSSNRIWISNIADMIKVSNIRIISMMNVADELIKKGYLVGRDNGKDEKYYVVPIGVVNSIRQNHPVTPVKMTDLTVDEFFDHLGEIFEEEDVNQWDRLDKVQDLVGGNMHLQFCKAIESYGVYGMEYFLLSIFANRLVNEDDDNIGTHDWEDFFNSKSFVRRMLSTLKSGTNPLIRGGILEPISSDGVRDPNYYHLTAKAKDELFPDMELTASKDSSNKNLTSYSSFAPKQLFYAPHIQSQIDRLAELLQPEQFKNVTDRLSENGMRKGFACLFYGSPGTGKTETVNQLARMTGRDVLMVDVSQIKSCWVGESEKNIKAMFDRYRRYVNECKVAPILLFNEADAVLGIRQEGAQKAVDKMENSIQNIILQEMENLEGIMIATTNLTSNLDKAFERRFIYKIEFERPTVEAKQQIWKAMIPSLPENFTHSLAKEFDLSGGQIENVARKRTVELILSGKEPSDEHIREYCQYESMDSRQDRRPRIGF